MAVIPTQPAERHAYFVALGRAGGLATFRKYGRSWMVELGKRGFATTLGLYGGDVVWRLLGDSYRQKFPDRAEPRRHTTSETREKARLRAEARRLYPEPQPCVVCGEPGRERHHVHGVLAGNRPDNVAWHCTPCHGEKSRAERRARWGTRGASHQAMAR